MNDLLAIQSDLMRDRQSTGVQSKARCNLIAPGLEAHAGIIVLLGSSRERLNLVVCRGTGSFLTNNQVKSHLNIERYLKESSQLVSTRMQINAIRKQMGLNMSEIAAVMGVSRQSIYDWVENDSKLRKEHQVKLDFLADICMAWDSKNLGRIGSYLHKKIYKDNLSLFQLLQHKEIDKITVTNAMEVIEKAKILHNRKLTSHEENLKKYDFEEISEEEMDKNLGKITREIG